MHRTNIIITIDTESLAQGGLPIEKDIYGEVGREPYGVEKIMDMCDARGFKSTFFVDVVEHHLFGKTALERLCRRIDERRHDVQLHIHPNLVPGQRHKFMSHYDVCTQTAMIREGKQLIEKWIGKSPVAFRAGCYGANLATIQALKNNGLKIDSSYFTFHRNCDLSRQLNNRYQNVVFDIDGVTEIPVTVYKLFDNFLSVDYSKIDINACTMEELSFAIDKLVGRVDVLILFLHSFSFFKWDIREKCVRPNGYSIAKFEHILDCLSQRRDADVVTMAKFNDEHLVPGSQKVCQEDFAPTSHFRLNLNRLFAHR